MLEFRHEHPILSIHRYRQQVLGRVLSRIQQLLAHIINIRYEISHCILRSHRTIIPSHTVRNYTVTENHRYFTTIFSGCYPRHCKVCSIANIDIVTIHICRFHQKFFISYHPFDSYITHRLNHSRANRFLRRPHSNWAEAHFSLEQIHTCCQVVLHIIWPSLLGYSDSVFHLPSRHHQQRHNRVVIWSGCQLDLAGGSQAAIHRQDIAHMLVLCIDYIHQISMGKVSILLE